MDDEATGVDRANDSREEIDLDEARLGEWLGANIAGFVGPVKAAKFAHGQSNPTYRLDCSSSAYVLRRKPFGLLLPSAHAIEREYLVLKQLRSAGFPVPRALALCEDPAVIGSSFFVMELVEGKINVDGSLPDASGAEERRAAYLAMVDTLAALHNIDPSAAGLQDFGRSGDYFARQVERWTKQYRLSQTDEIADMERLIDWLPTTRPRQGRTSVVHGDYRIDNLIFASDGRNVSAVLDWELSTIGDPLADFAYFLLSWELDADGRAGLGGLDLETLGIPARDEIVSRYCAATERDGIADLEWLIAFNFFRMASIGQGIRKRLDEGNASSPVAASFARQVAPLAKRGWSVVSSVGA